MNSSYVPSSLTSREACIDAVLRFVTGLDTKDASVLESALESAWTKDAIMDQMALSEIGRQARILQGLPEIKSTLLKVVGKHDSSHMVTNVRVDLKEGDSKASLTAYSLARHFKRGEGLDADKRGITMGNKYDVDLVKDDSDGIWKIQKFTLGTMWWEGDKTVVQPRQD